MTVIAPITQGLTRSAGSVVRGAISSTVQSTAGNAATGEMASLASTGLWSTVAYLGQALKSLVLTSAPVAKSAAEGTLSTAATAFAPAGAELASAVGATTTSLAIPALSAKLLSIPFYGAVAVGDALTAGSAGLAAYSLNSFTKIATGKGIIGNFGSAASTIGSLASSAGRGIAGLFKAAPKVV